VKVITRHDRRDLRQRPDRTRDGDGSCSKRRVLCRHATGQSPRVVRQSRSPGFRQLGGDVVKANRSSLSTLASLLSLAVWQQRGDAFPVCAREWVQVGAPTEDYDLDPVGFTGWMLKPEVYANDVPFTHPFGNDWQCMLALDPEYTGLLAAGNVVPDGADGAAALADAKVAEIPVPEGGLPAVETDGGNVPSAFKAFADGTVRSGDRIAVFGRWIVDAGHSVRMPAGGEDSYRSRYIHRCSWPSPERGRRFPASR
jgi:hypothetical protein